MISSPQVHVHLPSTDNDPHSPIALLPPEMLGEVFRIVVASEATGADRFHRRGLRDLISVCHHWRKVALHIPDLWTCLQTRNSGEETLERYIRRSGKLPLTVVVEYDVSFHKARLLEKYFDRIQSVCYSGPQVCTIQNYVAHAINFDIEGDNQWRRWIAQKKGTLVISNGPPIRHLSLWVVSVVSIHCGRMQNIQVLSLVETDIPPSSWSPLIDAIANSIGLRKLSLTKIRSNNQPMLPDVEPGSPPHTPLIHLPDLSTLSLYDSPSPLITALLARLEAPNCRQVKLGFPLPEPLALQWLAPNMRSSLRGASKLTIKMQATTWRAHTLPEVFYNLSEKEHGAWVLEGTIRPGGFNHRLSAIGETLKTLGGNPEIHLSLDGTRNHPLELSTSTLETLGRVVTFTSEGGVAIIPLIQALEIRDDRGKLPCPDLLTLDFTFGYHPEFERVKGDPTLAFTRWDALWLERPSVVRFKWRS